MDPNATLARIRELIEEFESAEKSEDIEGMNDASADMVQLVRSLDEWLSKGGYPPRLWTCPF